MAYVFAGHFGPDNFRTARRDPLRAPITVYLPNRATLATLYTDKLRSAQLSNPLTPNSYGNFEFWAEPGEYQVYVNAIWLDLTVYPDPSEFGIDGDALVLITTTGATLDVSVGTLTDVQLTSSCNVVFHGAQAGVSCSMTTIFHQTGSFVPIWTANTITWMNSATGTVPAGAGKVAAYTFLTVNGGASWLGFSAGTG